MVNVYISEEYGYYHWWARLEPQEFEDLKKRWVTMRGLHCLVPVWLIIPQAVEVEDHAKLMRLLKTKKHLKCHIHECDDSHLEGVAYHIPKDKDFWIDGIRFTDHDLCS